MSRDELKTQIEELRSQLQITTEEAEKKRRDLVASMVKRTKDMVAEKHELEAKIRQLEGASKVLQLKFYFVAIRTDGSSRLHLVHQAHAPQHRRRKCL